MPISNRKQNCDKCHEKKRACKGNTIPCNGCEKLGVPCTFLRPKLKVGRPKSKQILQFDGISTHTRKRKYSRKGCYTCKMKKRKCDEIFPQCGSCQRLNIECKRPGMDNFPQAQVNRTISDDSIESSWEMLLDYDSLLPLMDSTGQSFNRRDKMMLSCLMKSPPSISLASQPLDPITCSSVHGMKNMSPCMSDLSEELDSKHYEETRINLIRVCETNNNCLPWKEVELLKNFIKNVSFLLFVDKTTDKFLSTVIPLCLEDHRVRYPVIAIAASNKANSYDFSNESKRDKVFYRAKAQTNIILESADSGSQNLLLGILLVCVLEILEGDSLFWSISLEKATQFIQLNGGFGALSRASPLIFQLFCYLDMISSLSTCSIPHADTLQNSSNHLAWFEDDQISNSFKSKFGFKFGIAGELLKIIGNISTLSSMREARYTSVEKDKQFNLLANIIEMKLQIWTPPMGRLANEIETDKDSSLVLSSFTLAFQWAAFLRLHQVRYGYDRRNSRIEACVSIILRSIKVIDMNSDLELLMMFPLVMAGSVAVQQEDRDYIMTRIQNIKHRLRFNYISEFEKLLLQVWSSDKTEGDSVNWAKIRFFQFPGLVMF